MEIECYGNMLICNCYLYMFGVFVFSFIFFDFCNYDYDFILCLNFLVMFFFVICRLILIVCQDQQVFYVLIYEVVESDLQSVVIYFNC